MSLWELVGKPDPVKPRRCLVCDKTFRTTAHYRTCPPCHYNEKDRETRDYPKRSTK